MSLGYVGHARLEAEDTEIAIYSYTGENWNVQDEAMCKRLESTIGKITIDKSCFSNLSCTARSEECPTAERNSSKRGLLGIPTYQD